MRIVPYQALRENAAWINLSGRGYIRVGDEDRARLLHAMTTNHVQQLQPGQGCYAFFLNATGRILGDSHILCADDAFLLDTEPETHGKIAQHIERYVIADAVTVEDLSDKVSVLAVEGPAADAIALRMGIDKPPAAGNWTTWNAWQVAAISVTGLPGFRFYGPRLEESQMIGWFAGMGLVEAGRPEWDPVRIENARPRYGDDISEQQIPHETQLLHAIHFSKGCYLGQEIVERVRSRGHVNRKLVQLKVEGKQAPAAKTKLTADGKEVGEITTAAYSPANDCVMALGYVRVEHGKPGSKLDAGGASAEVTDRAPA
ncbi:MAG: glycine cleavage T C-terminal barrel domain-containing protein [Bryobacteraceae bacterium]